MFINPDGTLWAEYGARVQITSYDYPSDSAGTIIHDYRDGRWLVLLDAMDNTPAIFDVSDFDVTQSPAESAYRLTTRWSVDECLTNMIAIADAVTSRKGITIYSSALVFELYRLNYYAESSVRQCAEAGWFADVDPDKYSHDEDWGAPIPSGWDRI